MSSVRVTVFVDAVVEAPEEFNLALTVSPLLSPAITVGNIGAAVGIITDTTSKCIGYNNYIKQFLLFHLCIKDWWWNLEQDSLAVQSHQDL